MTALDYIQQAETALESAKTTLQAASASATPSTVKPGDSLQAAVDAAQPGDTILVDPSGSYTNLRLRAKRPGPPITIAPNTANLKPGQRVDPSALPDLIKLTSADGSPIIQADPMSSGYVLRGFAPQPFADGGTTYAQLTDGSIADPTQVPGEIVIDQWLMQADPVKGGKRAIAANARNVRIANSYVAGFWFGADAQAICGWSGTQGLIIENNHLEGGSEPVLLGGVDAPSAMVAPRLLVMRGNYVTKPLAWQTNLATGKNAFELKCALTAIIEGNVFEYAWPAGGQSGALIDFTVRNQDGGNPLATIADVLFRYNVVRHGGAFFNILGADDSHPSVPMARVRILNNLMYDMDPSRWSNATGRGSGRTIQIIAPFDTLEIGHNTMLAGPNPNACVGINSALAIPGAVGNVQGTNFSYHDNITPEGDYGITGTGAVAMGWASLNECIVNPSFVNNVLIAGSGRWNYGPGPNTVTTAPVVDPTTLQQVSGVTAGCDLAGLKQRIPDLVI